MIKFFISILIVLGVVAAPVSSLALETDEQIIRRAEWPTYVNGANISALPQVQRILGRFDENDQMTITIYYPGGAQGTAWARQLHNWFIAYGVPAAYLQSALGSGAPDQLRVVLVDRS